MRFTARRLDPCEMARGRGLVQGGFVFQRLCETEKLPHFAAVAEQISHQAQNIIPDRAIDVSRQGGSVRRFELVAQKADIVLSCLTLLRGHGGSLRAMPIGRPW